MLMRILLDPILDSIGLRLAKKFGHPSTNGNHHVQNIYQMFNWTTPTHQGSLDVHQPMSHFVYLYI